MTKPAEVQTAAAGRISSEAHTMTELLEIHLFDFSGDLYGKPLEVEFHDFLRPERRFDGIDALKDQIARDAGAARRVLTDPSGPA